jgi:competence protein ComEC
MQSPLTLARLSLARLIRGWWTATGVRASGAGVAGVGSVGTGAGWATVLRMTTARLGLAGLSLREWGFAELSLLRLSLARLNWARTGDLGRVSWPPAWLATERTQLVLWLPVLMGAGVLTYFALHKEPPVWIGAVLLAPALAGAWLAWPGSVTRGALVALTAFALGLTTAQFATWRAAPLLVLPTHAVVVTGVVRQVDLLPAGRRLLLEAVRLDGAEQPLARAVRVRLRTNDPIVVATGDTVRVRALLRVPATPAYPGGWDLQRDAFFSGLGGSGFALGSATLVAAGSPTGLVRWIQLLRERIGTHFIQGMPGAAGTIAATLFTGNSGAIPVEDHDAFRASGLAHLLAVAGLHIGIVMGWTMLLTRVVLSLCEYTALRWPTKQIGAFVALAAGGGYMVLTGMHVPIMRSFAMAALYTVAVVLGRRAVSLRGLGLAGVVLMLTEPQEVPGVSFQMSFGAVLALISGYEVLRPHLKALHGEGGWRGKLTLHLTMLGLTSLLAGTASMPFGAYHFGRIQVYFVISNMVAVPLTAFWVMPLGLVAMALMPLGLGLDRLVMLPMGWGVEAILWVARTSAAFPASTLPVPHSPAWGLALVGLGMAWLGLWRSRIRLAGIVVLAVGLASPLLARPADVLVSEDGRLIAVQTPAGVFVEQGTGASRFIRDDWTEYWGDGEMSPMPRTGAAAGGAIVCDAAGCLLRPRLGAVAALLVRGKVSVADCRAAAIEVAAEPARGLCPKPWPKLVDRFTVWRYGATAIWLRPDGAVIVSDRWLRGTRPWVAPLPARKGAKLDPKLPVGAGESAAARE